MAPPPTPPSPLHKLSFVNATPPELDIPPMPQQKAVKKMSTIVNKGAVRKMRKPEARSPAPPRVRPAQQPQSSKINSQNQPPANAKRDIEKRMAGLQKANEKLREKGERLVRELGALRDEENLIEQERDRLQQLWMCSRSEIEDERDTRHDMERAVQRMKTHHEATITQLRQKMRSLLLAARSQRVSETQTELVYVGGPFEDREVQTVEELTRDRANVHLRENDAQLVKLLDEMEREKLNAQSDLKYAIVQLEQRMREENDNELRRLRDEKLRQLEEISTMHAEELRTLEEEVIEQSEKSAEDISRLQDEVARLEADRDELRIQLEMSRGEAERAEDDAARCRRDKDRIEKDHSKLLARSEAVKRDAALMDKMKREVAKYRDINEILMSEYSKLEDERDALVDALDRGVTRLESINKSNNYRLRDRLDEIDKRL
ncbi:hypothetical protein PFISCL1PPCAC_581 [Pristionchus fissidentatus]|uniref:Uncharacterized protein n=1 Tax=Pristionchus fissidentatus TaxID=1538716 RepID=A0AAV5USL1_9BILA|nr:hypothetical protein PFISCL1PPCAC_581 [Pristionchus fissidentatus]